MSKYGYAVFDNESYEDTPMSENQGKKNEESVSVEVSSHVPGEEDIKNGSRFVRPDVTLIFTTEQVLTVVSKGRTWLRVERTLDLNTVVFLISFFVLTLLLYLILI